MSKLAPWEKTLSEWQSSSFSGPMSVCPLMCLPCVAIGTLRTTVSPYHNFAWRNKRCPLCLGFQLPSSLYWAFWTEYNLPRYMLRPWPLQFLTKSLCLALPLTTWVIQACIYLPGLPITANPWGSSGPRLFYPNLGLSICHQEMKHWSNEKSEWKGSLILHTHNRTI